jgi:hypothetical protein
LAWPKIPFSVRLVEPVQTAFGTPFLLRTKNLLCMSLPCTRPRQSALMCAAAIASVFFCAGPMSSKITCTFAPR